MNNIRVQFELPEDKVRELEELMKEVGIATRKSLFNNALSLFEWVIREKRAGKIIASIDERNNRYKELVLASLVAMPSSKPIVGSQISNSQTDLLEEEKIDKNSEINVLAQANAV